MKMKCKDATEDCLSRYPNCPHRNLHEMDEEGGCDKSECLGLVLAEQEYGLALCTPLPYTTNITGLAHSGYKLFASKVLVGMELTMVRDPENVYDKFAIQLLMPDGTKLGWVQRIKACEGVETEQSIVSDILDAGEELTCTITSITPELKEAEGKIKAVIDFKQQETD